MLSSDDAEGIAADWDLGDGPVLSGPPARGELGQVWRIETARSAFAVKEWFGEPDPGEILEGAAFQEAALAQGVACPAIVPRRDGSVLARVSGTTVAVYGWVDLRDRDTGIDAAGVGRLAGALHLVAFQGSQPLDPWYAEPIGRERWEDLITELRDRRAPFAARLAELRDELVAIESLIEPPPRVRTCHRDLWADNLRATADGNLCLIDWDNAGLADPGGELATLLFEFTRADPRRGRALVDAYVDEGGPARVRGPSDFSMPIAQLSHIGERCCRLWLEAANEGDRERAARGVWEFVGEPLTREVISDLLDAIA